MGAANAVLAIETIAAAIRVLRIAINSPLFVWTAGCRLVSETLPKLNRPNQKNPELRRKVCTCLKLKFFATRSALFLLAIQLQHNVCSQLNYLHVLGYAEFNSGHTPVAA
jgi:hypothetical protein